MTLALALEPDAQEVQWRYHFTEMRSGALLATLPLRGASFTENLSGAGDGEGTVPITSAEVVDRDPWSATIPRRCVVWPERQVIDPATGQVASSAIMWGGPVVGRDTSRRALALRFVSWAGYFQRRMIRTDRTATQVDKFELMRWLFRQALTASTVAAFTPDAFSTLSGVLADRTYLASDEKPVLEAAKELASSGDGFDWRVLHRRDPAQANRFLAELDLGYPRLGRITPPGLTWAATDDEGPSGAPGELLDYKVTETGQANNYVTAIGSGTGPLQLRSTATGAMVGRDEEGSGWPRWEGTLGGATQELTTQATIDSHVRGAILAGFASELQIGAVTVRGDLAPYVDSYAIGDDLQLELGRLLRPDQELAAVGQLIARKLEPPEQGRNERVTMTLQGRAA